MKRKIDLKVGMSPREQDVYFSLLNKERAVTTIGQVSSDHSITGENARKILFNLDRKKVIYRIFRGCYVVIPPDMLYKRSGFINDPHVIIDQLMEVIGGKYYVGYQSALHLHGLSHQLPFTLSVAVLKQRKPLVLGGSRIEFRKISEKNFFGIERMKYLNSFLNVSDVEKTLIDCVDRYDLCGGIDEICRTISDMRGKIKSEKLLDYLGRLKSKPAAQRLGFMLDKLNESGYGIDENLIAGVEKYAGKKKYLLEPKSGGEGKLSKRWGIIENVNCMGWEHA
jgi:predicted transcriptional regulator of viral defense system